MGKSVREVLLTQRGLAFVACEGGAPASAETVRAVELELAALGYVPSAQLHARLAECSTETLTHFHDWACETLREHLGASEAHEPLFRRFPDGVPDDTLVLWWEKVLVHFLQAKDQPCLFCGRTGTTHVLNPCLHVVCDQCFDGANYSACPVCEHHVDRSSPFFQPVPERGVPEEDVKFKLLHLGGDPDEDAVAFHHRLLQGAGGGDAAQSAECGPAPILAVLYRGDAAPPQRSECYALFRDRAETTIAASDLLS